MVLPEDKMRQEIIELQHELLERKLTNDCNEYQVKMKGSSLKKRLDIGAMIAKTIEKIKRLSDEQDLVITVKSGIAFGEHSDDDWIVFTYDPVPVPNPEWFDEMRSKDYESEREVETYFIAPILEKLGYSYDDIVIGYPLKIPVGRREYKAEADVVLFNGRDHNRGNALLIFEAKNSDITNKDIDQIRAYAKELMPIYYILTNARKICVFAFNGMKTQDTMIMSFDGPMLKEVWKKLYRSVSKKATIKAKEQRGVGQEPVQLSI